ncbi:hypothetical protein H4219_000888 [Mycoemilia scoparia]|uniref:NADH dehydrogenase [ubiquinone] 1 beta subcomplex subunit 11, mitochondrial n=1 Tax=Mycoemilia scoparia TaxID=417184 RepID=A0A9W8DW20_9FUNG|nr:hypothetical protein H4219_000888 [Mycoemilia scoparia]
MFINRTRLTLNRAKTAFIPRGGHGPKLSEPTGYLFGRKPGEKVEKEGWETYWLIGFWGSLATAAVGLYYKPDTRIRTKALEEAKRRMDARGDTLDYPHTIYRA